jgi:hypothetical protein
MFRMLWNIRTQLGSPKSPHHEHRNAVPTIQNTLVWYTAPPPPVPASAPILTPRSFYECITTCFVSSPNNLSLAAHQQVSPTGLACLHLDRSFPLARSWLVYTSLRLAFPFTFLPPQLPSPNISSSSSTLRPHHCTQSICSMITDLPSSSIFQTLHPHHTLLADYFALCFLPLAFFVSQVCPFWIDALLILL